MSIQEIKEQLKTSIDKLSPSDTKLASKDLDDYFNYLRDRREMPGNVQLSFGHYQELITSLQQADNGKSRSASKVLSGLKAKYGKQA